MRAWLWMILLAVLPSHAPVQAQATTPPTRADVLALEERWTTGVKERDHESFEKLLAEDLTHVGFEGQIVGKREYMEFFKNGDWRYSQYAVLDQQVTLEGCAAIVTGRVDRKIVVNGKETIGKFSFTHVWAKRGSEWRVISSQVSASPNT
jgi:ketosteroid isomerase-like protein